MSSHDNMDSPTQVLQETSRIKPSSQYEFDATAMKNNVKSHDKTELSLSNIMCKKPLSTKMSLDTSHSDTNIHKMFNSTNLAVKHHMTPPLLQWSKSNIEDRENGHRERALSLQRTHPSSKEIESECFAKTELYVRPVKQRPPQHQPQKNTVPHYDKDFLWLNHLSESHGHTNSSLSKASPSESLHSENNSSVEYLTPYRLSEKTESFCFTPVSRDFSEIGNTSTQSVARKHNILTPSPRHGAAYELEHTLRDKDATIQHLRDIMEKNELAILQVCAEKERSWELEFQKSHVEWERRLQQHHQKTSKMEQALLLQLFKVQQDYKALMIDLEKLNNDKKSNEHKLTEYEKELKNTQTKLEEMNWEMCQKTGEISLLKSQLKESKDEVISKKNEVVATKYQLKNFQKTKEEKELEILNLEADLKNKNKDITHFQSEITNLQTELDSLKSQQNADLNTLQLRMKTKELEKLDIDNKILLNFNIESSPPKTCSSEEDSVLSKHKMSSSISVPKMESADVTNNTLAITHQESEASDKKTELEHLKSELASLKDHFKREREQWLDEKNKVIRYQKHLQLNYVQMYRKNKMLEAEVEQLTLELEKRDACVIESESSRILQEESMCSTEQETYCI